MTLLQTFRPALLALAVCPQLAQAAPSDPLQADPAAIRVTLTLPAGIGLVAGSASLQFGATNSKTGVASNATDALSDTTTGPVHELRLSTPETAKLRGVQADIAAWKAKGEQGRAAITVGFTPCLATPGAAIAAPMGLSIRYADTGPNMNLVDSTATLADFLKASGQTIAACP